MSVFDQAWKSVTGIPATDMTDKRYTFVKLNTSGKIVTATAGSAAIGVLYEPNKVDEPAQVVAQGYAFVKLGAALQPGTPVMSDDNGYAVAHTVATAPAYNYVLGILVVGGNTGDIGTVLLK